MKVKKERTTKKQQNIFALLTDDPTKQALFSFKSKMMIIISLACKEMKKPQKVIAEILDIPQPQLSLLLSGSMDLFTISYLIDKLIKLNYEFDIAFNPKNINEPLCISINKTASKE